MIRRESTREKMQEKETRRGVPLDVLRGLPRAASAPRSARPKKIDDGSLLLGRIVVVRRPMGRSVGRCAPNDALQALPRVCFVFRAPRAMSDTARASSSSESSSVWRARVGVDRPEPSSRKFPNHCLCARFSTWTLHLMYVLLLYILYYLYRRRKQKWIRALN